MPTCFFISLLCGVPATRCQSKNLGQQVTDSRLRCPGTWRPSQDWRSKTPSYHHRAFGTAWVLPRGIQLSNKAYPFETEDQKKEVPYVANKITLLQFERHTIFVPPLFSLPTQRSLREWLANVQTPGVIPGVIQSTAASTCDWNECDVTPLM